MKSLEPGEIINIKDEEEESKMKLNLDDVCLIPDWDTVFEPNCKWSFLTIPKPDPVKTYSENFVITKEPFKK